MRKLSVSKKTKIYFWLKLDNNFFKNLAVRALRKRAGGDTYLIIYQRLLLEALESNGVIEYQGLLEDLPSELAITLDEKEEDVRTTIEYFKQAGLIQIGDDGSAFFEQVPMLIDQETNWNRYKRNAQKNKKLEKFQPPSNHLPTDIDIEKEIKKEIEVEGDIEKTLTPPPAQSSQSHFNLFDHYQERIGVIDGTQMQKLNDYINFDDMEVDLVKRAIDKAADNGKRYFNYIESILKGWNQNGIKTVVQQDEEQRNWDNKKSSKKKNSYIDEDEAKRMQEKYGF